MLTKLRKMLSVELIRTAKLNDLRVRNATQAETIRSITRNAEVLGAVNRRLRADMLQAAQDVAKVALHMSGDQKAAMFEVVKRLDQGAKR